MLKGSFIMAVKEEVIDNHLDHIINFRRRLHKEPELSFKEYETTKLVQNGLEDTKIKFYELSEKTGVIGLLEKDPKFEYIGVRADMDALPLTERTGLDFKSENDGVMHACGQIGRASCRERMKLEEDGDVVTKKKHT